METRILPVLLLVFIVTLMFSVNFAFCRNFKKSKTTGFDYCTERVKNACNSETLSGIGSSLLADAINSTGFVYSEFNIVNKLLQLFKAGTLEVKNDIKQYLGLPNKRTCDPRYCQSFNNISDFMKDSMGDNFLSGNVFYKSQSRPAFPWDCGTVKEVDFGGHNDSIVSVINKDYQDILGTDKGQCLQRPLNSETDFFLQSTSGVKPALLGDLKSYTSDCKFTDIDGKVRDVDWVGTDAYPWIGETFMPETSTDYFLNCDLVIYRTEVNGGKQYMLYFMVTFRYIEDLNKKLECLQIIMKNLRYYTRVAINAELGEEGLDGGMKFTTLLVPVMSLQNDFNLKTLLEPKLPNLFKERHINNLYRGKDTLHEMRMCESFSNKDRNYTKIDIPIQVSDSWFLKKQEHICLYDPFIFNLVDKETGIYLKTGAYFRP